jgi:hypothetical protein
MDGPDSNFSFTVIDYAYADPGEPISIRERGFAPLAKNS